MADGSTPRATGSILPQQTKPFWCSDADLMSWASKYFVGSVLHCSQPFICEHSLYSHCHPSLVLFPATSPEPPSPLRLWTPQVIPLLPTCFSAAPLRANLLLMALPSEEPSPLQLPSALSKSPLPRHAHRTSFPLVSFIWGNSWTIPAVSLHKQFRK